MIHVPMTGGAIVPAFFYETADFIQVVSHPVIQINLLAYWIFYSGVAATIKITHVNGGNPGCPS